MHKTISLLITFVLMTIAYCQQEQDPIVKIDQGELRGAMSIPAEGWKGIRDATKFGQPCAQTQCMSFEYQGVEDCLTVNVFTPKLPENETKSEMNKLPVLVWIYGGAFMAGSGDWYSPSYFIDEDIIVVTFNYRVGALGFLNAGIPEASGNQGLKDQVLLLRWVQKNIEKFGGDKDKVTIGGQSAGGMSAHLLTLSGMYGKDEALFRNAIVQSGVAITPWTIDREPIERAKRLAVSVDCPTSNIKFMVECLSRISPEIMANKSVMTNATGWEDENMPGFFRPSVELNQDSENTFLREDPYITMKSGEFRKVPILTGVTMKEMITVDGGLMLNDSKILNSINEEFGRKAPKFLLYEDTAKDPCVVSGKIKKFYFNDSIISKDNEERFVDLNSDRAFIHSARVTSLIQSKNEGAPVYFYYFIKKGQSFSDMFKIPRKGEEDQREPGHVDDMQYLFECKYVPPLADKFTKFSKNFVKLWASFVKDNKPTQFWGDFKDEWKPVDPNADVSKWLYIGDDLKFGDMDNDMVERMKFWDDVPIREYGKN